MYTAENDYSPIVRQGSIEQAGGILGRRKARKSLPNVEHGFAIVYVGADGSVTSGSSTAGERYWGSARAWVIVDMRDHHLIFRFPYRDTDGATGYDIQVSATVAVSDPAAAVRRRVQGGVRAYVEPSLRARVTQSLAGSVYDTNTVTDTLTRFNLRLGNLTDKIAGLIGLNVPVADWLDVRIADASSQFDAATTAHYDQLVAADRTAEVDTRTIRNKTQTDRAEIKRRELWARYLGEQMSAPLTRAVAAAAADPTAENIQAVADKLDEDDHWQRSEFVNMVNRLIDNKVIVEVDDIRNTKVIIDNLRKGLAGERAKAIDRPQPDKMIPGAGVVTDDDTLSADSDADWDDDKNWGN